MEVKEEDFVPGAKGREEEEDDREDNSSSSSSEENSSASTPQDGLMVESGGTTGSGRFSFDALICQLGEFGLYQRLIFFLLWIPAAASSVGIYASIFLEFTPDHRCVAPDACDPNPAWLGNLADPECTLPIFRNESTCEVDAGEAVACPEVLFDDSLFQNTVVTEFLGVCSRAYLKSLSSTSYMSGMLVGSFFFGWISDMFGRRFCFSATVLFLAGGSILAAASSSYPMYIVSRFISSMGGIGLFITAFVLSMEFIGPNYRTLCGIAIEIPFALGELYLVLLAYFVREWRQLQLLIGIPFLGFFLYLIKLPESIRWCLTKGKVEKARETLKQLAKMNGAKPPTDQLMETFGDTRLPAGAKPLSTLDLLTSAKLRPRLLIMVINWIVATLSYYGLSLSASLSNDVFTTFTVTALMEIPSYLFCIMVVDRWGRKPILTGVQTLAAIACITAGCLPGGEYYYARLALTMAGKFGASAAFAIVFLYTAELFPTPLRNSAVGLCSTCARLGGICAPLVTDLGTVWPQLPFLIIGVFSLLGGLAACWLPETAGKELPDTMEEALAISRSRETVVILSEEEKA